MLLKVTNLRTSTSSNPSNHPISYSVKIVNMVNGPTGVQIRNDPDAGTSAVNCESYDTGSSLLEQVDVGLVTF